VRIVRELVSNAVRFTPKGGRVSLTLNVTPQHPLLLPSRDAATEWLRVDVSDTGPGIRPEDRERVFAAFERVGEPQFTVSDANPGLGLTLAKHYAVLLGGDILLETAPGKGSTFSLLLPVKVCVVTHIS
jgi:signal transduction histidine kinase